MSTAQKKANEISAYYIFHKKIELIFHHNSNHFYQYNYKNMIVKFFSNDDINKCQNFYLIEKNFIQNWETYVNYQTAKQYLDKINALKYNTEEEYISEINEMCNNMVLTGEIKEDSKNTYKPFLINNNGYDLRNFINKIIYNLDDFDYLIDENTLNLFYSYEGFVEKELEQNRIEGLILDKMIALLIKEQKKIKFLFKYDSNILQITADFNVDNAAKSSTKYFGEQNIQLYEYFYYNILLKKEGDYILNEFIKQGILQTEQKMELKSSKGGNICYLKNDSLYKNKINIKDNNKISSNEFQNVNIAKFIGLANIGATCYMNATLQNLINTDLLTRFLLNEKNYNLINNDLNNYELCSKYCEVLYNTCIKNNKNNYYEPKNFKEIISRKNPLFEGIQANDSKDLINFLLEEMHNELKLLENNKNNNPFENVVVNQKNPIFILNNFKKVMSETNRSIISKLFYILVESITHCQRCNSNIYNYEVTFYIEFPLENVYNYCCKNNIQTKINNKIIIPLLQCFNNYLQPSLFTGENQIYCNICKCQNDATYINNFYSFPPILIIILNRGKGNQFDCDVDFPFDLNLQNYCKNYEGNINYKLKGLITHLGTSDMGGHFIAYCRHRITNEWYCYNDAIVTKLTDQNNGYKKGTPYILFYEGIDNKNNYIYPDFNNNFGFNINPMFNGMNIIHNIGNNMVPINNGKNFNNINNNGLNQNINNNFNINSLMFTGNNNINQNFNCINNNMNGFMNINNNINNNMNNNMNNIINMNNNMNMNNNVNMNKIFNNNIINNMNNNMNYNMMKNMNNNTINNMSNNMNNNMNNNMINNLNNNMNNNMNNM